MALDAFMAHVGVYSSVDAAKADYDAVQTSTPASMQARQGWSWPVHPT